MTDSKPSAKNPFEIARETLKQLTARKLMPTPLNYQAVYNEIAGIPNVQPFPEEPLRQLAAELPAKNPGQERQLALLDSAIGRRSWAGVQNALVAYLGFSVPTPSTMPAPLSAMGSPPLATPALTADFLEQIARLIEHGQPALGTDDARFAEQTQAVLKALRQPDADLVATKMLLANYSHRVSFTAEDQAEIKANLLRLLHLIFQNIGELSLDDRWLKGQIDGLMVASTPPLSLRRLDDLERRLKDVIFKQTEAKGRALEAQEEMRQMLLTFVERLSQMSDSTSVFQIKLEENARLIEQAKTLAEIAPVLKEVVGATRGMASDSLTARDELRSMREKTMTTDAQIAKLHQELDRVSTLARHDPLTGALNRKGLDEAVKREVSNFRRKETPLSVGLLDIDNFKLLNDRLGHATGDEALAHLSRVARECMRPQDTLARYGGEEFVILLPDTPLDKGIEAMTRLQRELTTRFFLAGTEKIMITFSAGVAQLAPDETGDDAIKRADQAMYLAKRAGKNRVLGT
ncbi:MAG TPA: GGDEF domain-containing protein [Burkholderiaceae bacterium]|nr:GGDEF domain-containing protein [Burkholderiaceae bacterium]